VCLIIKFSVRQRLAYRELYCLFMIEQKMFSLNLLLIYLAALSYVLAELDVRQANGSTTRSSSASSTPAAAPVVDLGYGIYQGYYNVTSKLNIYKG
jgi:hypothetical protein